MEELKQDYYISVQVYFYSSELWVRISGHIYVTMNDILKLKDAILELMKKKPTKKGDKELSTKATEKTAEPTTTKEA